MRHVTIGDDSQDHRSSISSALVDHFLLVDDAACGIRLSHQRALELSRLFAGVGGDTGCLCGVWAYKRGGSLLWPRLWCLLAFISPSTPERECRVGFRVAGSCFWSRSCGPNFAVVLPVYSFVASAPVWFLLQPRDFINSHQLVVGLSALILGLLVVHPPMEVPAFRAVAETADGAGKGWFPLLFVTIACGAVSGFHGLVSSGTTAKQIRRESDAKSIGYGAMLGEGTLALVATLAATAGFAVVADSGWEGHFASWSRPTGLRRNWVLVQGSGVPWGAWGFPIMSAPWWCCLVISCATPAGYSDPDSKVLWFKSWQKSPSLPKNRYLAVILGRRWHFLAASPKGPGSGAWYWPVFGAGINCLLG